jgi:STAM-binding protein
MQLSLRVSDKDAAGNSSFQLGDSSSCGANWTLFQSLRNMEFNKSFLYHKVTKSSPSPALCCVETVSQDEQNSHITAYNSGDGSTNSDKESSSSKTVRDVHIVRTTTAYLNTIIQQISCVFSVLHYDAPTLQI